MIIQYNQKEIIKKSLIIIAIVLSIFIIALIILKYEVEGEDANSLPFKIEKVTVATKLDGIKNEDSQNLWNIGLMQVNDIYIKIAKNNDKEIDIKNVSISNIQKTKTIGAQKITRISKEYIDENLNDVDFNGENSTKLEELKIAKTGGIIGFRYIIDKLGNYISNEEAITYNDEVLVKTGIDKGKLNTDISFDIIIELETGIKYKTTISTSLPVQNVKDINLDGIIFKRILQN